MKIPSIPSIFSRGYTRPDTFPEKHPHDDDDDEGSGSGETLLEETSMPSHRVKGLSKAYLILLPVVFGLGLALGFTSLGFFKMPVSVQIHLNTPIPNEIFDKRVKIPFVPDNRYYGSGDTVDQGWKEITKGGDSVWLQNPSDYGLDKGISDPFHEDNTDERFYLLSNLHQLHCLNVVRLRFRQYESQLSKPVNESETTVADWKEHTDHCFEYLRLSITCGDFLVMEPASPPGTPPELTAGGLGWGVVHECIDFDGLRKWQAEKRHEFKVSLY